MTITAENNLWFRQKRPAIDKYLQTQKQVEEVVAGRGFLNRPGYLGAMTTAVEREVKFALSDINYEITKQMIERELAQSQFDYDISFKESRIAWELEKASLLTSLEQEFAFNKGAREQDIAQLDRDEITINLRRLVLMAAKTAIDEDVEAYRQELTQVDQSTFAAEDALLAAKLLTANKKLEVIPYINIVLDKQQEIITAEQNNATLKEALITEKELLNVERGNLITAKEAIADAIVELIAAKQVLVVKKGSLITAKGLVANQEIINMTYLDQYLTSLTGLTDVQDILIAGKKELIPYINDKSTATIAYTVELDAWIIVKKAIAVVKEQIAGDMETRVDRKGDIIDAKVSMNDLQLGLKEAQINLEIARMTGKSDLLTQQTGNASDMLTERKAFFDSKITRTGELFDAESDFDLYREQQNYESMKEINDYVIPLEESMIKRIASARINERGKTAEIAANKELTSSLMHLLA